MATHVPFTDNYEDLSTDRGFQFKFFCERCGNGYMSSFQQNASGVAGDVLRAAGGLFGGLISRVADSTYDFQRAVGGPQHDAALRKAVEELRPHFSQCRRCGQWVCSDLCWNITRDQCTQCSPRIEEEIAAIESEATIAQLREKAMSGVDLTAGYTPKSALGEAACATCGAARTPGQRFCGGCGASFMAKPACKSCGAELQPGQKFCSECGARSG